MALGGFLRGQGAVLLILAVYYGIALSLAGLHFGLAIGIITGLFSFIPYLARRWASCSRSGWGSCSSGRTRQ